jgi:hypothetical protein
MHFETSVCFFIVVESVMHAAKRLTRLRTQRPMIPCVFWLVQKSLLLQETPLFLDEAKVMLLLLFLVQCCVIGCFVLEMMGMRSALIVKWES